METTTILNTDGTGYWSRAVQAVVVTGIDCLVSKYEDRDGERLYGELRVGFDTASWLTDELGLIYTDKLFLKELREFLVSQGFTAEEADQVEYSEQGMQGDDYVSLDADAAFCSEWLAKFPQTEVFEY
jgi:hypothetical protein